MEKILVVYQYIQRQVLQLMVKEMELKLDFFL
jgi:hypothetical protein